MIHGDQASSKLDDIDRQVLEIIAENGPICKTNAKYYGMPPTTFRSHAMKLVDMGILVKKKMKTSPGRGRTSIMYMMRDEDG